MDKIKSIHPILVAIYVKQTFKTQSTWPCSIYTLSNLPFVKSGKYI